MATASEMPILADFSRFGHHSAVAYGHERAPRSSFCSVNHRILHHFLRGSFLWQRELLKCRFWPILADLGIIQPSPTATNRLHRAPFATLTIALCIMLLRRSFLWQRQRSKYLIWQILAEFNKSLARCRMPLDFRITRIYLAFCDFI